MHPAAFSSSPRDPSPRLEPRATGFWNKYKELDDFRFLQPGPTQAAPCCSVSSVGAAGSRGAEGEIAIRPVDELTFLVSYNYDLARVVATKAFVNRVPLQWGPRVSLTNLPTGAEIFAGAKNVFDRQYTVNLQGGLESLGLPRTIRGGLSLRSF
jgi:outer membrane receptor protein involved in Fe transport